MNFITEQFIRKYFYSSHNIVYEWIFENYFLQHFVHLCLKIFILLILRKLQFFLGSLPESTV